MDWIRKIIAPIIALVQVLLIGHGYIPYKQHIDTPDQAVNILLPGLLGFGENVGIDRMVPYFGALTGIDIGEELEALGYETYQADIGPVSSAWDRSCELYAMLTGTQVDYGAAHAQACGHERYGKTYDEPLFENWSAERPVNLIGHSFGGNTARMFALLCDEGSADERAATPEEELSPLFAGGMIDRVHSITSLGSPHNGTSAQGVMNDDYEEIDYLWIARLLNRMGTNRVINGVYDLQLEHFGMSVAPGGGGGETDWEATRNFLNSLDHAFYDNSLDGAAALNAIDKIHPSVYYFSYASVITTSAGSKQVPVAREALDPVIYVYAAQIGLGLGTVAPPGDEWLVSDGIVPLRSAQYPDGQPHQNYIEGETKLEPGIWNVMPIVKHADHAYWCGGDVLRHEEEEIMDIYIKLMERLDGTY